MFGYVKRYWWLMLGGLVLVYAFKPGWLKFKFGGGPVGGPIGGTVPKPAAGTGGEF